MAATYVLVLTPVRELAVQVRRSCRNALPDDVAATAFERDAAAVMHHWQPPARRLGQPAMLGPCNRCCCRRSLGPPRRCTA